MARALTIALIVAAMALVSCATSTKHPGYEDAIHEARRNLESPEGTVYARAVRIHVGRRFGDIAYDCYVEKPEGRGLTLLFRLDGSGNALETITYPETEFGACVRENIDFFPLPPPPEPDYWYVIGVGKTPPDFPYASQP